MTTLIKVNDVYGILRYTFPAWDAAEAEFVSEVFHQEMYARKYWDEPNSVELRMIRTYVPHGVVPLGQTKKYKLRLIPNEWIEDTVRASNVNGTVGYHIQRFNDRSKVSRGWYVRALKKLKDYPRFDKLLTTPTIGEINHLMTMYIVSKYRIRD